MHRKVSMKKQNIKAIVKRVVVVDHFDSFTYNIVALLIMLGAEVHVVRTNSSVKAIKRSNPTHIVLSAGEGHPKNVRLFHQVLKCFKQSMPILGVCLGHQAIGLHFGATIDRCEKIMHGKTSMLCHDGTGVFSGLEKRFEVMRYHSLVIRKKSILSGTLRQTAQASDGTVMGVESVEYPHIVGVQFHPESYFTKYGSDLFANFLSL